MTIVTRGVRGRGSAPRRFFGLPRNVVLLGWTSFFTDAGSEMIMPVLPLFLRGVLKAPMMAIGLIEGVAEAIANLMRLISGLWADRIGRAKPFVYAGYGLSTVMKPLLALAHSWPFVLGIRFMDRVGKGLRTAPRDSLLAASTPRANFGKAYGFHRAMDTAGAVAGSAIAAVALWSMGGVSSSGVRWLFVASVIPCLLAVLFIMPVREPATGAQPVSGPRPPQAKTGAFSLSLAAWTLLAGVALWELGNISYVFVLLRLNDLGVPERFIPLAYLAFNVLYMLAALPAGMMADRIGIRTALLLSPLFGAAAYLTLGSSALGLAVSAGLVLFALHSAVVNVIPRAGVAHFAPAGGRGTLFGLVGVCAFLGNTFAGALWQWLGSGAAMQIAGLLSLLSLIPFAFLPNIPRGVRKYETP